MAQNVLEFLERSAERFPDSIAFEDQEETLTYREVREMARRTGSAIARVTGSVNQPVVVFMDKNIRSLVLFLGTLYSGNFYCPLDSQMPESRIRAILQVTEPEIILTDRAHSGAVHQFADGAAVICWEDIPGTDEDPALLAARMSMVTENDPLYVLFTSGSTGVPKGVVVSHHVIINYLEWLDQTFDMDEHTVFGNQAPLYFDISVHDLYGAIYFGAKMVIIPPALFSFPVRLVEFMNEKKISTFLWVPSAMSIVAALKTFRELRPAFLNLVMFAGEVLPRKYLDYWMEHLPDARFANLYGPTETFVCTAYLCTGQEPAGSTMPIGRPVRNVQAYILDEDGQPAAKGATGELCLAGSCLATGYYNNPEKTEAVFVRNPGIPGDPGRIYRTGDLVRENEDGDLIYLSRRDYQIKHMGYRIELGEIETAAYAIPEIRDCVCIYDEKRKRIVLYYDGKEMDKKELRERIGSKVPDYMIPGKYVYLPVLPPNANGKIDRKALAAGN